MPTKSIRFNYFTINLVPVELPPNMQGVNYAATWDMADLLDYLSVMDNEIDCAVNVREYIAEFDRHTIIHDERARIYSFQIGKLRENNIPPKKRIGIPKEDLFLQDDEYIGEFVTIVFDERYCTVALQSNNYSLNVNQVEIFLTEIRRRYKQLIDEEDEVTLRVELQPIVDATKVESIGNADIFRKISIRGSNTMADALAQQGTLREVSEIIGRAHGINFDLTISLGQAPKTESLDTDIIQEIIQGFNQLGDGDRPKIEITAREDDEAPIEVVNLLTPRLTNIIKLNVENRRGIGHEYIHAEFMERYPEQRRSITRILPVLDE
ncbi:hypothetical protein AMR94_23185 [Bacillus sp. G3(2015)]|uniref:DUF6731 family protein n=1 Tax=Bacillus sp. G3(2015) TaxID=1706731 RepID=UPI000738ABD0|nr:DUF6731 family protein [Bacillus sp. G3(2015)]KUF27512.1 hypothetical protein AMR94_23185 [Bacillus sp. G3(2015)]